MDWHNTEIDITDGMMYRGDSWLGTFSSQAAGLEALQLKRGQVSEVKCKALTESDHDLLLAIDADED